MSGLVGYLDGLVTTIIATYSSHSTSSGSNSTNSVSTNGG